VVVESLGTVAPPATIGGYAMSAFEADGLPNFQNITEVASPLGGFVSFGNSVQTRSIGAGWATWSHGFSGDIYLRTGTSLSLTLPDDTGAFYLYVQPDQFGIFDITVSSDGSALTQSVSGSSGAKGWGFHAPAGGELTSIAITSTANFGLGEFGIAAALPTPVPEPASAALALAGLVMLGAATSSRRRS
jgi:MYXO-CTERM domain-containing protein